MNQTDYAKSLDTFYQLGQVIALAKVREAFPDLTDYINSVTVESLMIEGDQNAVPGTRPDIG